VTRAKAFLDIAGRRSEMNRRGIVECLPWKIPL
jgi:hypothetical protein